MSAKARSLLKKLRTKKHEEEEKEERERPKSEEKRIENIKKLNLGAITDNKSGKITYIDPLDFFKIEHPLDIDKNMDDFGLNDSENETNNEENKNKEEEKKPKMKALIGASVNKIKFDEMMKALCTRINDITGHGESVLMINARTHDLLATAARELENAMTKSDGDYDILAEHVRYAADAIGKILGTIGTSEILDATFSQLCLGK